MNDAQTKNTWTPERVKQLLALRQEGKSASEIAMRLRHGVTRNAVIGKLDRLGIKFTRFPKCQSRVPKKAPARPKRRQAGQYRPNVFAPPAPVSAPSTAQAVTIMGLRDGPIRQCRWPVGRNAANETLHCGDTIAHRSYCAYHDRMAWRSVPSKHKHLEAAE